MNEEEFWAALTPTEPKPILYRLYYDDQGRPLFYSQEDLPGNYIDITREVYVNPPTHIKVVNNSMVVLDTSIVKRLYPAKTGIPCHPEDVSVVVEKTKPNIKWSLR
jgi:hypothetical protein